MTCWVAVLCKITTAVDHLVLDNIVELLITDEHFWMQHAIRAGPRREQGDWGQLTGYYAVHQDSRPGLRRHMLLI